MDNIWSDGAEREVRQGDRTRCSSLVDGHLLHRQNMLDSRHRRFGVGVAIGARGTVYAVQAFS